jgi:hypothetical protein
MEDLSGNAARLGQGRNVDSSLEEAVRARVESSRSTNRLDRLYDLASRITERDRAIARLLAEHRVLTTPQLRQIAFDSDRKAQQRLALLYSLEVVDRFRRRSWSGTGPYHFTLGHAGAEVVAAERGITVTDLGWQRATATVLQSNAQLAHLVGCNGVFAGLIAAARQHADASLAEWWSSRRCAAAWGNAVRPDGYGVYVEGDVRLPFLLEYDTGSETLVRLEKKLDGYAALGRAVEHPTWVCFAFLTPAREASARRVLVHPEVPVATAVVGPDSAPSGPVWLAIGDGGPRSRLVELGHPSRALGQRPTRSQHA